jgi:transcriptional regulator with XRE-family HTH domain
MRQRPGRGARASKRATPADALVGQNVRICRLQRKLTQSELGRRIGVSFQQVQKYENGGNRIGAGRLTQIADVLGVPPSALFDGAAAGGGADLASVREMVSRPRALRLLRAYDRIKDRRIAVAVLALVEALARATAG